MVSARGAALIPARRGGFCSGAAVAGTHGAGAAGARHLAGGLFCFAGGGSAKFLDFFEGELAVAARFEVEDQGAVTDAANLFDVVADFLEHLADFAVAAFDEDQFVPGIVGVAKEAEAGGGGHDAARRSPDFVVRGGLGFVGIFAGARADLGPNLAVAVDHDAVAELVEC
jgi:hypothetical protein